MKIHIVKVLTRASLLAAMLLVTAVASTQAQSLAYRIKVNIPFDFSVGEKKLPAGTYSVGRVAPDFGDSVIAIAGDDGGPTAIRLSIAAQRSHASDRTTLVFRHYGDQYFLFQVWPAGATTGRQFPKSRSQREIERKLARNSPTRQTAETVMIVGVPQ